ncbi:hypothetical protein EDC56_2799 [Sinobacterium caligoides]|uniref:Uncharacterized protein n=1 Tax=Sinobacterium caligoides TaxID=933926 RepID=A0A3N2DK31_9GAMM|nr:hypothetical protein [Sinobacterium caligoides]ROS00163.1 hypothetical protein EDC56_2799 [Sinobacterium caligoides]
MTDDQLQFIDYRKPKLEAGDYRFTVTHQYGDPASNSPTEKKESKINIRATGTRVDIAQDDIFAQFPHPGDIGDFTTIMPHISFKKGTLPWLRSAYLNKGDNTDNTADNEPWLYLMGVNQLDIDNGRATFNDNCLLTALDNGAYFPKAQKQQLVDDLSVTQQSVKTVDIKKSLFRKLFCRDDKDISSNKDQIEYLAHIRRRWQPQATDTLGDPINIDVEKGIIDTLNASVFKLGTSNIHDTFNLPKTAENVVVIVESVSWLISDPDNGDILIDTIKPIDGSSKKATLQVCTLKRELSVLVSNRLGQADHLTYPEGTKNHALVVSLEQYLKKDTINEINELDDDAMLRFIVLTAWSYTCTPSQVNFQDRTSKLDVDSFRLTEEKREQAQLTGSTALYQRLCSGYVALPHQLRQGAQSASWYRGPFSPTMKGGNSGDLTPAERGKILQPKDEDDSNQVDEYTFETSDADRLLCIDEDSGLFDVNYSSAYELGRLLSFKNSEYTQLLSQFKSAKARYVKLSKDDASRKSIAEENGIYIDTLPYAKLNTEKLDAQEKEVGDWLISLAELNNIPTWCLIADPELLPTASVRTFSIDSKWIQSLWLGALSLNGRPELTYELFDYFYKKLKSAIPTHGALLRSDVVWAYPELVAEFRLLADLSSPYKIPEKTPAIEIIAEHNLAPDTQLFLTKEPFNYLSLSLPIESLHYGISKRSDSDSYYKILNFKGHSIKVAADGDDDEKTKVPLFDTDLGIIQVKELADNILNKIKKSTNMTEESEQKFVNNLTQIKSARLGRFMLKGEPKVEFVVTDKD